jgi:hypothetical protein
MALKHIKPKLTELQREIDSGGGEISGSHVTPEKIFPFAKVFFEKFCLCFL